jgi:hypothetical protein
LPDSGSRMANQMAVTVSGQNIEKLLAIPELSSATGPMMDNAVVEVIKEWSLKDAVAGLCFDTTIANTGIHRGAITVVQQAFEKRLLFIACRHHIFEIMASAMFDCFFSS